MAEKTSISWCDHTFNPWWGCAKVSPACDHCYAERDANRYAPGQKLWGPKSKRRFFGDKHWNEPLKWNRKAAKLGERRRVFCASMADVFDNVLPELDAARARLWELIKATPNLDWLLLTKRIGNAPKMLPADWGNGYPNAWLGISAVTQEELNRDGPKLARIPAVVHFLSGEPLLEKLELLAMPAHEQVKCCGSKECAWCSGSGVRNDPGIQWVIVGGESGPGARPMHPEWARNLRDDCARIRVPFLFKQWGEWEPREEWSPHQGGGRFEPMVAIMEDGSYCPNDKVPQDVGAHRMARVGKKSAGDRLDGVLHQNFPQPRSPFLRTDLEARTHT